MTDSEYRQDDRTEGYCPICRQPVSTVYVDGAGWCPDHGRVWCDWTRPNTASGTDNQTTENQEAHA